MPIRSLLLAGLLASVPFSACDNMVVGDVSRPDRASQRYIETLTSAVRQRFAALAGASRCRQEDNRYSYDLLMSKLNGAGRAILEQAALKGTTEDRSSATDAADDGTCKAAIDKLRAADDQLLILSERFRG